MATDPFNPSKYRGIEDYVCVSIVRDRDPTVNDIRDPRTGRYYQQNTIWMNEDTESFFALARIVANEAQWIAFGTPASGLLQTLSSNTGDTVTPDGASNIRVIGDTAQGVTGNGVNATHTITMTVNDATTSTKGVAQFDPSDFVVTAGVVSLAPEVPLTFTTDSGSVQADANVLKILGGEGIDTSGSAPNIVIVSGELATAGATVGVSNIGMAAYNSADFTVTAGFVSLKSGSGAVSSITGDDSVAVVPSSGNINISGVTVANATHGKSLYFKDGGSSTVQADIQVSTALGSPPADKRFAGLCTFDSSAFSVNTDGHVTLLGGSGPAVDALKPDFATAPGTDPVVANGSGVITVTGNTVANATNLNKPVAAHSRDVNKMGIEVQVSTAVNTLPGDAYDAGLASFETARFSVDSTVGYVDLRSQYFTSSFTNLRLTYSSPTLSVTGTDASLSSSNPAYVRINSQTSRGKLLTIPVTADVSMQDAGGTGDMNLNTFGTTTLIAWSDQLPLFFYAVLNDAETAVTFALSRIPHLTVSPAVANMAKQGSAVATTQGSMFIMDSSVAVGDYDSNPCVCLGSVIATKDAADAWTLSLSHDYVGLDRFADNLFWVFPRNQMGADPTANSCLSSSNPADTVPSFASNGRAYTISRDGLCNFVWGWNNITVAGAGTGTLRLHIPYQNGTTGATFPSNFSWINGGGATYTTGQFRFPNVASYGEFLYHGTAITNVVAGDITGKTNGTAGVVFFVYRS